jgi:hypothetical protein
MALGHSFTWPLQLVEALKELNHLSVTVVTVPVLVILDVGIFFS